MAQARRRRFRRALLARLKRVVVTLTATTVASDGRRIARSVRLAVRR